MIYYWNAVLRICLMHVGIKYQVVRPLIYVMCYAPEKCVKQKKERKKQIFDL